MQEASKDEDDENGYKETFRLYIFFLISIFHQGGWGKTTIREAF